MRCNAVQHREVVRCSTAKLYGACVWCRGMRYALCLSYVLCHLHPLQCGLNAWRDCCCSACVPVLD